MVKFGKWVVKHRILILVISILLLIPCVLGYVNTRVNYDILSYLPEDIDTMKGQEILKEEFGQGGFSFVIVEGMTEHEIQETADEIAEIDGVTNVICYESMEDINLPKEVLPEKLYDFFNSDTGDSSMMAVMFADSTSADSTLDAIEQMRQIAAGKCFVSGMSATTADMKKLAEDEVIIYVVLAVLFIVIVLLLTTDCFMTPLIFMLSIGIAILWNMGTNFFLGEISFITNALCMVLQLGVTMDYSIFLWHSYEEQKIRFDGDKPRAMAHAISATIVSVTSSSVTTVAGFLSMCFMSFTLGMDLGIVMAKGVICGVIACVTVLPALILVLDKPIEKTSHRNIIPDLSKVGSFIVNHFGVFLIAAVVVFCPMIYGYNNYDVYYNLSSAMAEDMDSVIANSKLAEEYSMNSTHVLMVDASMDAKTATRMMDEMEEVDGVEFTLGLNSIVGTAIPEEAIPESVTNTLKSGDWQMILVGSDYEIASDAVNAQVDELNKILDEYDSDGMLIGEAPATKDLIDITDKDFKVVNILSICVIFLIIALTFKSVTLPVILVAVIEFAIIINMGCSYFLGTDLPFIASVVVGTIQLGSTVDYAILMTTRYKRERSRGNDKKTSITTALQTSINSVIVSALGFFAATIGIGVYSNNHMISSLCMLLARGALISMVVVLTVLPSLFMLLDKIICKTSAGFLPKKDALKEAPQIGENEEIQSQQEAPQTN